MIKKLKRLRATKNICSSVNDEDNIIPKGSIIFEQLVKPMDNGVFIDGAGIYVDDLVFASSTEKIEDEIIQEEK